MDPWRAWFAAVILAGCAHAEFALKPWNGMDEWGAPSETKCYWLDVNWRDSKYRQCVRQYFDIMSTLMKREGGVWRDCVPLVHMWHRTHVFGSDLFVDAGANIGACTMLLTGVYNNISVVAFEPNPRNLFYFTRSLVANPSINRRVALYPYGLGDRLATFPIFMEKGNAGNSVLGTPVLTEKTPTATVEAVPLDAAFILDGRRVRVMKIDTQGFEVMVLRGSHYLLSSRRVGCFKFEVAPIFLTAMNTTAAELFRSFERYGYVLLALSLPQGLHPQGASRFRAVRQQERAELERRGGDYCACTAELASHLLRHESKNDQSRVGTAEHRRFSMPTLRARPDTRRSAAHSNASNA